MYFYHHTPYNQDPPILKSNTGVEVHKGALIKASNVGLNSAGVKAVPAGLFIARVGNENRFLPRDKTTAAVSSSDTIAVNYPELFLVGDNLIQVEALGTIALGGTWAQNELLTVSIGDKTFTFVNADAASTTGAAVATDAVVALNASHLGSKARFTASSGTINVYVTADMGDLAAVTNSASGTETVTNFDYNYASLGTILSIDHEAKTLTLTTNSAQDLDSGAAFGVAVDEVFGLYDHSIDFTKRPQLGIKAITGCAGVYEVALPYFDQYLRQMFPKIFVD
jgi:hypothetical protein